MSSAKGFNNLAKYSSETGKVPPQAIDVEEAVLGALMLERNALSAVIDILRDDIFYKQAHQKIFLAIHELFAKGEPVDIITVTERLKNNGDLEAIGGAYYISKLTSRVTSAANIEFHARILVQKHIQRELIRISGGLIRDAYEDSYDVFELMDKAENELFKIGDSNFRKAYSSMYDLVSQAVEEIHLAQGEDGKLRGVPSGFQELDRLTSGWQKSDLVIVAARPGMGKTAFVLSMARNSAIDFKRPVAVFSLEMSSVQLVTRLISGECELSSDKLKRGELTDEEAGRLNERITDLLEAPIYIDDTPSLSAFELRAKCRRLKEQHDIQMIIIDYIQLMTVGLEGGRGGNREQEISMISRSLKALAKELDVPVIVLSQLSRAVETRGGNKRPQLSDLRESGAIEQDADMVMFIYRPEYYQLDVDDNQISNKGWAQIIVAKNRSGELKDIWLKFQARYTKFVDPDIAELEMKTTGKIVAELSPNMNFDRKEVRLQSKINEPTTNNTTEDYFPVGSNDIIPF